MSQRIQTKRGLKANLPNSGMLAGELMITTDRKTLHVATDATTKHAVTPAIDDLTMLATVDAASDLVIIHDASEASGQKEKKMTFGDFKTALNIPEASSDEKVAVASGETSGFIYGTDGTDGVIRMGASMKQTKATGYVTYDVDTIDGGTF